MRKFKKFIVPVVMIIAMLAFSLTAAAEEVETSSEEVLTEVSDETEEETTETETESEAVTDASIIAEEPEDGDAEGDFNPNDTLTLEAEPEMAGDAPMLLAAPAEDGEESVEEVFLDENAEEFEDGLMDVFSAKGAAPENAEDTLEMTVLSAGNGMEEKNYTIYYICGGAVVLVVVLAIIFFGKKKKHDIML